MPQPRFRLFAGPNGSGKTFFFNHLRSNGIITTEIYVSADKIEADFKKKPLFNFNAYRVKVSDDEFKEHILTDGLYASKINDSSFLRAIRIKSGVLQINLPRKKINSYHASFIATYLVNKLLLTGQSFCFETVMSHVSKVQLLSVARQAGYKTYLYFVFTDNVELNIERVKLRVKQGQHDVDEDLIKSRYPRVFKLLPKALALSDEAFVIDNSDQPDIVAEKHQSKLVINRSASLFIRKYLK
ncbi:MAG: zeta toxin family protein [Bacteroidota bacterium]|nr:zeta toxin family protein [Bacteroidota bacterium]